MRKKLSAILLTLAMIVTMMPVMAFATEETVEQTPQQQEELVQNEEPVLQTEESSEPEGELSVKKYVDEYNLWVGVTHVNSDNASNVLGDGKVSFDPETSTLTLNNATITGQNNVSSSMTCIYSKLDNLIINLEGENQVGDASNKPGYAIYSASNELTITGTGTLTAIGSYDAIIADKNLTISGGDIKCKSDEYGIFTGKELTISGGKVEANGTDFGIQSYGNINVNGGTVNAKSTAVGIDAFSLKISGGEVNATTEGETSRYAISGDLIVSGGKVKAITESRSKPAVISWGNKIDVGDGMAITKPEGGQVVELSADWDETQKYKIITGSDGKTPATEVVIEPVKAPEPEKVVSSDPVITKMTAKGKKKLVLSWAKIDGADGYDVFFARCNTKKKKYTYKKVATFEGDSTTTLTKKCSKARTPYKAYVKAYVMENGTKKYITKSPSVHAFTSGSTAKYTNPKSVKVKKSSVTVAAGKTSKIKASVKGLKGGKKLISTKHAARLRYVSSDNSVATVTKKGTIKGVSAGTCKVYAIATNGVSKAVTVTVK